MADITVTGAQVGLVDPTKATLFEAIAGEAIDAGEIVYIDASTGKLELADGSAAGTANARGAALTDAAAGQAVTCVKEGAVYGYGVSALAYDLHLYVSDTAGALGSAASDATVDVIVARVVGLTDSSLTKVVYFDFDWRTEQA